ncbi:alpha/beta-hydrolase [Penicillium hispanicum]|uniref:alpha/beta-hydrolase n=1 Tax=Penicillium hispanicum TaxID=1080232 RepID=UPI0025403441|nr:alpha/beta-hydrolase [Penicillium hispanicum]KAJ5585571.1 alpha/beta-hydrolase [Penicillium hispanicum]
MSRALGGAGVIALLIALVAIYLAPLQDIFLQKSIQYGLPVPKPTVIDAPRAITYRGSYSASGVEHFQNIFYAQEPSGPRRFAPPVSVHHRPGSVIDATAAGAWCPQGTGDVLPFTSRVTNISENCLSLRIARPRGVKSDAKLPVVVWLHGGGHALGSASEILYHPDGLVKQAQADGQPLIYVAVNYRLGLFGFAASQALTKAKHTNVGLRDQRAALEFTAIGQSVGASDISLQLTAFGGETDAPFQQAVMMSGGPGLNFNTKSDLVANNTAAIAKAIGCTDRENDQSEEALQCLRDAPVELLTNISVAMSRAARPPFGEGFFYPTYDADFMRDRPSELMRAGKFSKGVPVIASWVTNDGAWYAPPPTSTDEEVLSSFGLWLFNLSETTRRKLLELYPLSDFEAMVRPGYDGPISPQYYRAAQMNRDIWFTCPVLDFAWQYVKQGGVDRHKMRLYEHNATRFAPAYEMMGVPMWRVAHLSDIPYVLNVPHLGGGSDNSAAQLELAREVSRDIVSFVSSGHPKGSGDDQKWPSAFHNTTSTALSKDFPGKLTIKLSGAPYGTQAVTVSEQMDVSTATDAEKAVHWEKLFSRCEFINSHEMRAEAGV